MFSALLEKASDLLERRFFLNLFLPSLLFWGLCLLVAAAGLGQTTAWFAVWNAQSVLPKTLQIIGFVVWVLFFATLLASQLAAILRLYEGYWDFGLGRWLFTQGQQWHQARLAALAADPERYEAIYLGYPLPTQPEQVMPTRLGNILKNAELYPLARYEIDAVLIWPRLYQLLPPRFIQSIGEARGALDFLLVLSLLSTLFALLSGLYLLIVGGDWWLFLLCWWGGLLVAWLAYRSAVGSAVLYAQLIKVAFDLYRNDLLKQMGLSLPPSPEQEVAWWAALAAFFYRNAPRIPAVDNPWGQMGQSAQGENDDDQSAHA